MGQLGTAKVFVPTGAGAIAYTLAPTTNIEFIGIKLHLDAVGGAVEDFTMISDSNEAAAFDTVHFTQPMAAIQDLVWYPTRRMYFRAGDEIDFAYANTNARTHGLEIQYRAEV